MKRLIIIAVVLFLTLFVTYKYCTRPQHDPKNVYNPPAANDGLVSYPEPKAASGSGTTKYTEPALELNKQNLADAIERISGGGFVYDSKIEGAIVDLKAGPDKKPESFRSYYNSDKSLKKALLRMPLELFKKFPEISKVKYTINSDFGSYIVKIERTDLQRFLGKKISDVSDNWSSEVIDPLIYNDGGRELFFSKFAYIK